MMSLSNSLLPNLISCCPVVYPSLINGYPTYNAHIQPHTQIQQLLFRVEKHNISHKVKGCLHATNVRFTNPDPVKWSHVCVCVCVCVCVLTMTTSEFGLLWLSDVKAGIYKASRDLSVKPWGAWGLSLYKSIRDQQTLTHSSPSLGKRPSKY